MVHQKNEKNKAKLPILFFTCSRAILLLSSVFTFCKFLIVTFLKIKEFFFFSNKEILFRNNSSKNKNLTKESAHLIEI